MVYQLIYGSSATRWLKEPELTELLQKARERNAQIGVTGMLFYHDGSFFQVLEGPRENVEAVAEKIQADPRHKGMAVFYRGHCQTREFGDWSMAFRAPSQEEWNGVAGFQDVLTAGSEIQSNKIQAFLRAFREMTRLSSHPAEHVSAR